MKARLVRCRVGRKEIREGVCCEPGNCAVALAIRKHLRFGAAVSIGGGGSLSFSFEGRASLGGTNGVRRHVLFFIHNFDALSKPFAEGPKREDLKPIRFSVRIPEECLK